VVRFDHACPDSTDRFLARLMVAEPVRRAEKLEKTMGKRPDDFSCR